MDLRNKYKNEECPACHKPLVFNHNYTDAACQDRDCRFNKWKETLSYYRNKPVKFAEDFYGVELHWYQKVMIKTLFSIKDKLTYLRRRHI